MEKCCYFVLNVIRELECVPDIWSLIEWSDWLTPRYRRRRFDTLFYLCLCEQKPLTNPDEAEVSEAKVNILIRIVKYQSGCSSCGY